MDKGCTASNNKSCVILYTLALASLIWNESNGCGKLRRRNYKKESWEERVLCRPSLAWNWANRDRWNWHLSYERGWDCPFALRRGGKSAPLELWVNISCIDILYPDLGFLFVLFFDDGSPHLDSTPQDGEKRLTRLRIRNQIARWLHKRDLGGKFTTKKKLE